MKSIHYDAEGDILAVTFAEGQTHTGVELSDNIIVYYNPENEKLLKLIMVSYYAMLRASQHRAIELDGLQMMNPAARTKVMRVLRSPSLNPFLQLEFVQNTHLQLSRVNEVFTPATWQSVSL